MRKKEPLLPQSPDDQAFFQNFYHEYRDLMLYAAKRYASTPEDCEDLVQDSLLRLMKNISTLRELSGCKIANYIVLTIRTQFIDQLRRKQSPATADLYGSMLEQCLNEDAWNTDTETDMLNRLEIQSVMERLPVTDRIVLEGWYIMGYSQEELAAQLGCKPDSIRMALSRARKKARALLDADGKENGK